MSGRPRLMTIIAAAMAAGLTIATVVAVLQWRRATDLASERDDQREVALVATAFGEAYLSYDYQDVEASSARVLSYVTADFAEDFEETSVPALQELFANIQTRTEASAQEVFVTEVDGDAARALVIVDVTAASTATGPQVLSNLTFVLDLVREDGAWRVDSVAPAPQPDVQGPGTSSTTTTTTTTTAPG